MRVLYLFPLLLSGCVTTRTMNEALKKQASSISQGCQEEMDQQEKASMVQCVLRECGVVALIEDNGIHHLWIKDSDGKPVDFEAGMKGLCDDLRK